MRTGSVVVEKFSINGYKTSNPVNIKKDVAEYVQDGLQREILNYLKQDSKLTAADSCDMADYRLVGSVKEINSDIESHYRFVTVTVNNKFEVDIEGALLRCKDGFQVAEFSSSKDEEKMDKLLEKLAGSVVKDVRKDSTAITDAAVK